MALVPDEAARRAHVAKIACRTAAKQLLGSPDAGASADEVLSVGGDREDFVLLRASIASNAGDHAKVLELVARLLSPNADARGVRAAAMANVGDLAGALAE